MTDNVPPEGTDTPNTLDRKKLLLAGLTAIAAAVVLVLPNYVSEPWIAPDATSINDTADAPQAQRSVLNPSLIAEKKQARQQAQVVLAEIVALRDTLEQRGVTDWAAFAYQSAQDAVDRGDDEYLDAEYKRAIGSYRDALEQLKNLNSDADTTLASNLKKGFESIDTGDVEAARGAADIAALIAPDNPRALLLTARATLLPDTLAQLRDAEQRLNAGQLDRAIAAYQRALAIDAEHQGAQQQLLNTQIRKRGRDFRAQMSRGWQALDNNQFERAEQAFSEAATIDGNSPAVPQARTQLATRKANYRSSQALQTALQLEREERWQQALDIYEQMLSEDNSLTEPRVRRVNASVRATLDQRVNALLAEPLKLADSGSYQRGRQLLRDLSGIADSLASGAGNSQLRAQIDQLDAVLRRSQTSTEVLLRSDGFTEVTLFRVSKLGTFDARRLQLKPGRYRASGARTGYRDVLIEFTVDGSASNAAIDIRCDEMI